MDRIPSPDSTILDQLTAYRRRYAEARNSVPVENTPSSNLIVAQHLDREMVLSKLLDLQKQAKNGMLGLHHHKGTFNPNTERYELERKIVYYGNDDAVKSNRYIFWGLSLMIDRLICNMSKEYVSTMSVTTLRYKVRVGYQSCYSTVFPHSSKVVNVTHALISDDLVRICATFECWRDSLLIISRDPGHFCGDLRLQFNEGLPLYGLDVSPVGTAGQPIPIHSLKTTSNFVFGDDVTCILIVENHSLFNELWHSNYHIRYKCVMVSLSGHPEFSVREFISLISAADKTLPVFCFCDLDVGGFYIVEGLKFGTPSTAFMHASAVCNRLQWFGICPSDVTTYNLQPDENTDGWFSEDERKKLTARMTRFEHCLLYWREELVTMTH